MSVFGKWEQLPGPCVAFRAYLDAGQFDAPWIEVRKTGRKWEWSLFFSDEEPAEISSGSLPASSSHNARVRAKHAARGTLQEWARAVWLTEDPS